MGEAISSRLVAPWLPESALLLVVGQSVGPKEWEQQRPFIGPAGQQLRAWLVLVGLDPDTEVAYTNVVMEYKPAEPNYEPTEEEVEEAHARIGGEMSSVVLPNLKVVVLLGRSVSHLALEGSMGSMQGKQGTVHLLPAFACYHPSFYLRGATHAEAKIVSV